MIFDGLCKIFNSIFRKPERFGKDKPIMRETNKEKHFVRNRSKRPRGRSFAEGTTGKGRSGNKLAKKCRKHLIFCLHHPGLFKRSTNQIRRQDRKRAAISYSLAHQAA